MLPTDLYSEIILAANQCDRWRVYNGMLAVPAFARSITPGKILDWMETCGVDVRIIRSKQCFYIQWTLNGLKHRSDGPAICDSDGGRMWYQHDEIHRDGEPAIYNPNGTQIWYHHDKIHRDGDAPAMLCSNSEQQFYYCLHDGSPPVFVSKGIQKWYQNGCLHRSGDKPAIIYLDGSQHWFQHGKRHRDGKPARIDYNGYCEWWNNGKLIRCRTPTRWDYICSKFMMYVSINVLLKLSIIFIGVIAAIHIF